MINVDKLTDFGYVHGLIKDKHVALIQEYAELVERIRVAPTRKLTSTDFDSRLWTKLSTQWRTLEDCKLNPEDTELDILTKTSGAKYLRDVHIHKKGETYRIRAIYYEAKKYTEDDLFILATNDVMTEIQSLLLKDVESKLVYIKELLKERVC